MIEIIEAISSRYDATPTMRAGLTGGFHLSHPGQGCPRPFAVLVPVDAPTEDNTSLTYVQDVQMQVSFFANTMTEIRPIKKAWIEAVKNQPMALSAGRMIEAQLTDERPMWEADENDVLSVWHYILEFTFTQSQTLPS